VEIGEEFVSGGSDVDHVAVTDTAVAVEVESGLDVEDHTGGENIGGTLVQAWNAAGAHGRKTDAVTSAMLDIVRETAITHDARGGDINISGASTRTNGGESGLASGEDGFEDSLLSAIGRTERVRASDVGPQAIDIRIAMDHDQVGGLQLAVARAGIGSVGFRGIGTRHAESEAVAAAHGVFRLIAVAERGAEERGSLIFRELRREQRRSGFEGELGDGAGLANAI